MLASKEHSPNRCAGCRQGIAPTEMIYKVKCGKRISQGEQICINEISKSIACIAHTICSDDLFSIATSTEALCILETDDNGLLSDASRYFVVFDISM
ncbi:unnamed protein product [Wuchereria bancrofti]|uniref:Uncharacterized protein n=1 Tax=Wuchereria bancrofti TaxID=6293 RepID=A0A3P7E5P2_WUCBA|nr:unnamed protein product [Wuchereria bancrofti]